MQRSALLAQHESAGARILPDPEHPTPLTFGDVPAEYAAGRDGAALFDQTDRGLLRLRGADTVDFLHRVLANRIKGLELGRGNRNMLLSSKGKVLHDFDLSRDGEGFLLGTPPGGVPALRDALDKYLFTEDIQLEDLTESHAPLALCGPDAVRTVTQALGEAKLQEPRQIAALPFGGSTVRAERLEQYGLPAVRLDAGPRHAPALWTALVEAGARPAGVVARACLRVENGSALFGVDIDENVYPQEARMDDAFSLEKGCYIGQEVVAKIDTYGGLNKLLMALRISHDDPIPAGTRLIKGSGEDARDLGVVTSWAYSFRLDTGLALGYVKRKHQELGTEFHLGETGATATIVPLPVEAEVSPSEA